MYKFLLTSIFLLLLIGMLYTPNYIPIPDDSVQPFDYQVIKKDSTVAAIFKKP